MNIKVFYQNIKDIHGNEFDYPKLLIERKSNYMSKEITSEKSLKD